MCEAGCIPEGGDCAGVSNATAEHIHNRPYHHGDDWWPLSSSAGWFPVTKPWGPERNTGSRNITLRGIVSWGSWADGINIHGGHHNVLIEGCEISFSGDDPFGLWPVSSAGEAHFCEPRMRQQNIVLRGNVARWPRQHGGKAGVHGTSARSFPDCDCSDVKRGNQANQSVTRDGGVCFSHACYATYASGSGVQFLNNHCEGSNLFLQFNGDYPDTAGTRWCGTLAVAGNTYSQYPGQGRGCMVNSATNGTNSFGQQFWCNKQAPPWYALAAAPPIASQRCLRNHRSSAT